MEGFLGTDLTSRCLFLPSFFFLFPSITTIAVCEILSPVGVLGVLVIGLAMLRVMIF